jgi:sugar/nucleoside kinase (ribokinase family)
MLTVFGSTALDTIRTPRKTLKNVLGGAATFAAISASNFIDTGLIAVVGTDFPKQHHRTLSKHLDLQGLTVKDGKTSNAVDPKTVSIWQQTNFDV